MWFRKKFLTDKKIDKINPIIKLNDPNPNVVKAMFEYLCKDTCRILKSSGRLKDSIRLLLLSKKYKIPDLTLDILNKFERSDFFNCDAVSTKDSIELKNTLKLVMIIMEFSSNKSVVLHKFKTDLKLFILK